MSTATVSLIEIAAEWRTARRLYPFYSALIREFQLEIAHCKELENPVDRAERDVLERVRKWFGSIDLQLQVAQMRQLLQTQRFGEEEMLRALLLRHLPQPQRDETLRDKLDYLLVQYFAAVAPHHPHDEEVAGSELQDALRPVLGYVDLRQFPWTKELDRIADAVDHCATLAELLQSGLVELGRKTKRDLGDAYFTPEALIQITRFNFRLRLGFFRLMHSDLHAIRRAIQDLESMSVASIDCREAGLGSEEPLATMRTLCHQWKKPFREAYQAGQSFRQLGIIRNIVVAAVVSRQAGKTGPLAKVVSMPAEQIPTTPKPPAFIDKPGDNDGDHYLIALEQVVESIAEQLFSNNQKSKVSTVVLGHSKEILASWEVSAFVRGGDAFGKAIQKAVAARCLLSECAANIDGSSKHSVSQTLDGAHVQAALIQEQVAKAKDCGDIDSAVGLAATAKRLLAVIDHTEKLKA
jgi:hypothetical protein